jgi:hypothetical protein
MESGDRIHLLEVISSTQPRRCRRLRAQTELISNPPLIALRKSQEFAERIYEKGSSSTVLPTDDIRFSLGSLEQSKRSSLNHAEGLFLEWALGLLGVPDQARDLVLNETTGLFYKLFALFQHRLTPPFAASIYLHRIA